MDPSGVLLALEEQRKWRERRERLRRRLKQLERRRAYLEKELERARKKMMECRDVIAARADVPLPVRSLTPTPPSIR